MIAYRAWTNEPLPPLTEEEKERAFAALRRERELVEEDCQRGVRWTPAGQEIDELRAERDRAIC